jgi:hypothetical protein
MPQIVSRIRWHAGMSRDELDRVVSEAVHELCSERLSENQRKKQSEVELGKSNEALEEARSELDVVILRQAETLGWRLLVSSLVLERLGQWDSETNGPPLFVRLGRALAKSVRIVQKRGRPPIDNLDLISTHDQAIRELKIVRREMHKTQTNRTLSYNELAKSFNKILRASRRELPSLNLNLNRWHLFFRHNPELLSAFASQRRGSPVELFYQWLSFCSGHRAETLRKKISALRSSLPRK